MKRQDVESLRDSIKSTYEHDNEYDEYEQNLMKLLEHNYINKEEFISKLERYYEKETKSTDEEH